MDHRQLEEIGETLRSLGHHRREVVQHIVADTDKGAEEQARRLYGELDRISEQCISLMQRQRELIAEELGTER